MEQGFTKNWVLLINNDKKLIFCNKYWTKSTKVWNDFKCENFLIDTSEPFTAIETCICMQSLSSTILKPCSQSFWCDNMKKIMWWPIEIILVNLLSLTSTWEVSVNQNYVVFPDECTTTMLISQLIIFATIINSSKPKRLLEICDNLELNWGMEFNFNLLWTHPSSSHWLNQKAISNYIRFCCILDLILPSNNISGNGCSNRHTFLKIPKI